jgi:hypothetical protein
MRLEPQAVTLESEGEGLYVCSVGCREQFASEHDDPSDTLVGYKKKE